MKHFFSFFTAIFFLISCSKNEEETQNVQNNDPLITKMNLSVLNQNSQVNNQTDPHLYFQYDSQNRLTKKIGGFAPLPAASGYISFFSNEIYTSLIYNNNEVTVEDFSTSNSFTTPANTTYYSLNNLSQIVIKETPNQNDSNLNKKQTYSYINNKLLEILTEFPNKPYNPNDPYEYVLTYLEKFYYNSIGNLTKTEYLELHNGVITGYKTVRFFENYDNSINPFKRLYLLNDFFYSSISNNNYRKYRLNKYEDNVLVYFEEKSRTFNYDSNGNIIID